MARKTRDGEEATAPQRDAEVAALRDRVEELEARLAAGDGADDADAGEASEHIGRRSLLRGAGALGLGTFAAGSPSPAAGPAPAADDPPDGDDQSAGDDALGGDGPLTDGDQSTDDAHDHGGGVLGADEPVAAVHATAGDFATLNGVRYPAPGGVQAAIDEVAAVDGRARVHLRPGTTYDPAQTWTVRDGVTLDYNGASVALTADVDLHDVAPRGRVERPVVDLRDVAGGYTSSVFVFSSRRHGFYGGDRIWKVAGGLTRGARTGGTLYEFDQGDESAIYFVHCDHAVREISTVVDMHRGDAFGVNGNRIYGLWYGFDRGIHMHNRNSIERDADNIAGNDFDVVAQPRRGAEILWDMEVGHHNTLRGRLWDFAQYEDAMWRIHEPPPGGGKHFGNVLYWHPIGGTESRLFEEDTLAGVFDDRHGDPRNRVVVPWLQGRPVSALSDDASPRPPDE